MTPVNTARGEVALVLDGQSITLRPSYAALVAAEAEAGPLFALIERAGAGSARITDIVSLLWHCAVAPHGMTRGAFENAVLNGGLVHATTAFRALLEQALGGPQA